MITYEARVRLSTSLRIWDAILKLESPRRYIKQMMKKTLKHIQGLKAEGRGRWKVQKRLEELPTDCHRFTLI